jgi:hypothetical protein
MQNIFGENSALLYTINKLIRAIFVATLSRSNPYIFSGANLNFFAAINKYWPDPQHGSRNVFMAPSIRDSASSTSLDGV